MMHSDGSAMRPFCYVADAVAAFVLILLKGENGEAYNIVNENSHSTIADMAKMVAEKIAGGKIKVVFDIPKDNVFGYASDTKMKLNADKMKALGWNPETDLENAYIRLIASLRLQNS